MKKCDCLGCPKLPKLSKSRMLEMILALNHKYFAHKYYLKCLGNITNLIFGKCASL